MKTTHPVTIFWLGFLIAISFFEAPLKFQAPSIDLAEGLEIGKIVFKWLNKVELVFLLILTISLLKIRESAKINYLILCLGIVLISQSLWLLPALDARAMIYINGSTPESSYHHLLYVNLEIVKVILLIWLAKSQLSSYRERIIAAMNG